MEGYIKGRLQVKVCSYNWSRDKKMAFFLRHKENNFQYIIPLLKYVFSTVGHTFRISGVSYNYSIIL